jgi:predicted transcriptional regulator
MQDKLPWEVDSDPDLPENQPTNANISRRLKEAREALGVVIGQFYEPLGISRETALAYESGKIPWEKIWTLGHIARAYSIPIDWIIHPGNCFKPPKSKFEERQAKRRAIHAKKARRWRKEQKLKRMETGQ